MKTPIVVRMAPSPTGNLHVGTARTTLFNYLFAKHYGGKFVMRIEDTDKERSTKAFEDNILEGLSWLGLSWDEFYRQSERTEIYVRYVRSMIENGTAYISKEEVKEEGQRSEVIRFKNPNKKIAFEDLIRGTVEFDTTELGDFVIARNEEEPLYHLAVVVDDHEMKVSHVIRGEDHISNTPRQILIQEAIGAQRPIYAHLPLILDDERKKLSKRKHGAAVWIDSYKEDGYLPEALLNFFAFLGFNPGGEREVFPLHELVEIFDINRVQKGGAIFDMEKLKWFNKEHMKLESEEQKISSIKSIIENSERFKSEGWKLSDTVLQKNYIVFFERIHTLKEITNLINSGEFDYMFTTPQYNATLLFWKGESDNTILHANFSKTISLLESVPSDSWNSDTVKSAIFDFATEVGRGLILWPMRVALSGKEKSPDPFTLAQILGKEETLSRLKTAQDKVA